MSFAGGGPVSETEGGRTVGYCPVCNSYGTGRFSAMRTAATDWIEDHVGCPGTSGPRGWRRPICWVLAGIGRAADAARVMMGAPSGRPAGTAPRRTLL